MLGRRLATRPSPVFRRLTFRRGHVRSARIAADGHTVIYSAAWEGGPAELFATRTDNTESRSLGVSGADVLAISGQGEMALSLERRAVLGFESTGTLARMPLSGGAPRRVLEGVFDADWAPDGETLAVVRDTGPARRLELPSGRVLFETGGSLSSPRVAPDGVRVAVLHHPVRGDNAGAVLARGGGRATGSPVPGLRSRASTGRARGASCGLRGRSRQLRGAVRGRARAAAGRELPGGGACPGLFRSHRAGGEAASCSTARAGHARSPAAGRATPRSAACPGSTGRSSPTSRSTGGRS